MYAWQHRLTKLVILHDVSIASVEQFLVAMFVVEEHLTQGLLDLALTAGGVLPAVEARDADNLVNFVHDTLDDDGRLLVARISGCIDSPP